MKHFCLLLSLCFAFSIKANIQNIPPQDIKKIKYFFNDLITRHDFAYTIFGSKPMSLADYCLKVPDNLPIHRHLISWYLLRKIQAGLEAWYKYRDEFDLKEFIFLDEEKDFLECLVL